MDAKNPASVYDHDHSHNHNNNRLRDSFQGESHSLISFQNDFEHEDDQSSITTDLNEDENVKKFGPLYKRRDHLTYGVFKGWRRRLFMIKYDSLLYYLPPSDQYGKESKETSLLLSKPRGIMHMSHAKLTIPNKIAQVTVNDNYGTPIKLFPFVLETGNTRPWYLAATTREVRDEWIRLLESAAGEKRTFTLPYNPNRNTDGAMVVGSNHERNTWSRDTFSTNQDDATREFLNRREVRKNEGRSSEIIYNNANVNLERDRKRTTNSSDSIANEQNWNNKNNNNNSNNNNNNDNETLNSVNGKEFFDLIPSVDKDITKKIENFTNRFLKNCFPESKFHQISDSKGVKVFKPLEHTKYVTIRGAGEVDYHPLNILAVLVDKETAQYDSQFSHGRRIAVYNPWTYIQHSTFKGVLFVAPRDLSLFAHIKLLPDDSILFCVASQKFPCLPEEKTAVRADCFIGGWHISAPRISSTGSVKCTCIFYTMSDLKGDIPIKIVETATKGQPFLMRSLEQYLKKLESQKNQRKLKLYHVGDKSLPMTYKDPQSQQIIAKLLCKVHKEALGKTWKNVAPWLYNVLEWKETSFSNNISLPQNTTLKDENGNTNINSNFGSSLAISDSKVKNEKVSVATAEKPILSSSSSCTAPSSSSSSSSSEKNIKKGVNNTSKDVLQKKKKDSHRKAQYSATEKFLVYFCFPFFLIVLFSAYFYDNNRFINISERVIDRFSNRKIPKFMIQGIKDSYKTIYNKYRKLSFYYNIDGFSKMELYNDTKRWYNFDGDLVRDEMYFVESTINETYWAVDSEFKMWLQLRNPQVEELLYSHPYREELSDYIICDRYPEMKEVYNELRVEIFPLIQKQILETETESNHITEQAKTKEPLVPKFTQRRDPNLSERALVEKTEKRKNCLLRLGENRV